MPISAATRSAISRASPVRSIGVKPSSFSSPMACALDSLTVSRTLRIARGVASQVTSMTSVATAHLDLVAFDRSRHADAGLVRNASTARRSPISPRAAAATASAIGCSDAASTACEAQDLGARRSFSSETSSSSILPSVTVPVLSRTIVSTLRVCSRDFRPPDEYAHLCTAPLPTISAVGVARPNAQGQAMISTETAAVKALAADAPASNQPPSVSSARTITIGTKIAETRSARRWTGALPD